MTDKIVTEAIARIVGWLGNPKETKKHPTVTLYTDLTARVIAVADLRAAITAMSTAQEPALDDDAGLAKALVQISAGAANGKAEFRRRLGARTKPTWHAVNALQDYLAASGGTARAALDRLQAKAPETGEG